MENKIYRAFKNTQTILLSIIVAGVIAIAVSHLLWNCSTINNTEVARNPKYEDYCDSIWYCNRQYYIDVLQSTEEYQEYIATVGEWWNF